MLLRVWILVHCTFDISMENGCHGSLCFYEEHYVQENAGHEFYETVTIRAADSKIQSMENSNKHTDNALNSAFILTLLGFSLSSC